jgi:hypothetical protein
VVEHGHLGDVERALGPAHLAPLRTTFVALDRAAMLAALNSLVAAVAPVLAELSDRQSIDVPATIQDVVTRRLGELECVP